MAVYEVKSPLPPGPQGKPALRLFRVKAHEELSRPFKFVVDLFSDQVDIDAAKLLGEPMTITVASDDGSRRRHFHGLVSHFSNHGEAEAGYYLYQAVLRPWIWFLLRTSNCRIFQKMNVLDIFEKVCKESHGFADYRLSVTESYTEWDYRVQYREPDFNFVSRLLEEEGVFYFFEHEEDKHTLILGDSYSAFMPIDGGPEIPFRLPGESRVELEHISRWHVRHEMQSGRYLLDDFDFSKPRADLQTGSNVSRPHTHADFEVFDYPGRYTEMADGEKFAKVRIEELQSGFKRLVGDADHRGMSAGRLFKLTEFSRDAENAEYALFSTEIDVESSELEAIHGVSKDRFDVQFVALPNPDSEIFRPARRTPKPFVHGPQTAIVVGKDGEEIWTDKYGRVKLQFHWDREGESNEDSSCWVRVSQLWAGKAWGGMQIPRIGQEVVVDFLEGDPDRPIITGRVYNDEQMPPYKLPDNQTQSGMISRSSKGGTPDTFNELRFEDQKDEEEVYFHAEKNFQRIVENDDILKVGFEKKDKGDQTIEVFNNQIVKIGDSSAPDGSQTLNVWKDRSAEIKTGDDSTKIAQGNHSLKVDAGKSQIEAAQSITLKVGGSTIKIDPSSITIKAAQISIEGQATLNAKSGAMTTIEGTMTTVKGSGMATIEGALVKIN